MICNFLGYSADGTIKLRAKVKPGDEAKITQQRGDLSYMRLPGLTFVDARRHRVEEGVLVEIEPAPDD